MLKQRYAGFFPTRAGARRRLLQRILKLESGRFVAKGLPRRRRFPERRPKPITAALIRKIPVYGPNSTLPVRRLNLNPTQEQIAASLMRKQPGYVAKPTLSIRRLRGIPHCSLQPPARAFFAELSRCSSFQGVQLRSYHIASEDEARDRSPSKQQLTSDASLHQNRFPQKAMIWGSSKLRVERQSGETQNSVLPEPTPFYKPTPEQESALHIRKSTHAEKRPREWKERSHFQGLRQRSHAISEAESRDPRRSWQHLRFDDEAIPKASNTLTDPEVTNSLPAKSEVERLREERLARTKAGRFVGFTSRSETERSSRPPIEFSYKPRNFVDREDQLSRGGKPKEQTPRSNIGRHARTASADYVRGNSRESERKRPRFVSGYAEEADDEIADIIEEKRQRKKERAARKSGAPPTPIILPEFISVNNLATILRVPMETFGAKMDELGFKETNHDHILDGETAGLIASEFNYEPSVAQTQRRDIYARPPVEDKSLLHPRPPVVTIMGHVDHGKTTLLDWLRKTSVAASEHGGITQHIGAFSVSMPSGRLITFLDTPGHAAFLNMRQRGANVTDIVILVVAADDSVKPQTLEALKHSVAANVPIIVAVNKVDKGDADVDRVKKDLARYGVEIEDYGGDTQVVPVSGKTGQGMVELEDAVIALADVLDMRAETDGAAEGWVLEATKGRAGRVATVLVSRGTLRPGDVVVAGLTWARVRTLRNEGGASVLAAGPGTPVEVDGWREQPTAGDQVLQAENEQLAKSAVERRIEIAERDQMATDMAALNESRRLEQQKREQEEQSRASGEAAEGTAAPATATTSQPGVKEVVFIIKADVSGSAEAVLNSVSALGNSEVRPHVLRSAVGPVTEFDIEHASTAKGHIISFNTVIGSDMARLADQAGVQIIDQSIIYRLVDDVKAKLSEQLAPLITQRVLGEAEIAQVFQITVKQKVQVPIAGCKVRNGTVTRKGKVRVMRDQEVIYDGMFLTGLLFFFSFFFSVQPLLPPRKLITPLHSSLTSP